MLVQLRRERPQPAWYEKVTGRNAREDYERAVRLNEAESSEVEDATREL